MMTCPVLGQYNLTTTCIEWKDKPRQGQSKSRKQNTQNKVSLKVRCISDIVSKLCDALETCRKHQTDYSWKNTMQNIDMTMSHSNKHQVICIDFGAQLDLFGREKDCSSVNNHAVCCICYLLCDTYLERSWLLPTR